MHHELTPLEAIIRTNEDAWDRDTILSEINRAVEADAEREKIDLIEKTITKRINGMLKYLFGACQTKPEKRAIAEKAAAPLERIVSQHVSDIGDPHMIMETYVTDDIFDPTMAEALFSMEDALHEKKDPTKPAAAKTTLRELMRARDALMIKKVA